jgi:hypothetical protein
MKAYGEWMHRSTFSWPRQYLEVSGQLARPCRFTPEERAPGTHWIGGWVGLELRPLGRPTRSQSLYRLRYSGSLTTAVFKVKVTQRFCHASYVFLCKHKRPWSLGRSGLAAAQKLKKNGNKAKVTKCHRTAQICRDCLPRCTQITEEKTSDRGRVEVTRGWWKLHVEEVIMFPPH